MEPNRGVNITHVVVNRHGPMFAELIELLTHHLDQLGVPVTHSTNHLDTDRLNIVLGATLFLGPGDLARIRDCGAPYAVFQSEALDDRPGFADRYAAYLDFLARSPRVWDYSPANLAFLAARGRPGGRHVPLGYAAPLERIPRAVTQDIDVLFYGAPTPRRVRVLEGLRARGARVAALAGVYGRARDEAIARSQVVLNLHQFDTPRLEQVRLSYLLNNRCFVVSEAADDNPYGAGVVFRDYADVVECCLGFLGPGRRAERERVAEEGYRRLQAVPTRSAIRSALEELDGTG